MRSQIVCRLKVDRFNIQEEQHTFMKQNVFAYHWIENDRWISSIKTRFGVFSGFFFFVSFLLFSSSILSADSAVFPLTPVQFIKTMQRV